MPPSPGLVAHILDLLGDWGGVAARRMFSGYGLYRHGAIFGLIIRDALYLRVDDRTRPDFVAAGSRPFRYQRGPSKQVEIRSYMECPPDLLEDAEELVRWASAALATARTAKPRAKAKARKTPKARKTAKARG